MSDGCIVMVLSVLREVQVALYRMASRDGFLGSVSSMLLECEDCQEDNKLPTLRGNLVGAHQ